MTNKSQIRISFRNINTKIILLNNHHQNILQKINELFNEYLHPADWSIKFHNLIQQKKILEKQIQELIDKKIIISCC